jgi:anti-anti-sigma regulatory factor
MKPEFSLKKLKAGSVDLLIKGDLTAQHSMIFKESLAALISQKGKVTISLNEIESIDISAIQLISAFQTLRKTNDTDFSIGWPENQSVNELLTKTGIRKVI